ncbi:MAG TPA: serine hydrolase domain-containing protein [Armatimonadota bacterium]|nr:serine hydrolase domain-containing protein [Armatimonadota bacterium]HQK95224.1 serine hydrolase domain-containing protein [Armatimonadota bacterium]
MLCLLASAPWASAQDADDAIPVTPARTYAGLEPFDTMMVDFIRARGIPGAALAVTRNGRLILATGYGWADRDAREPVRPDSLFRIASASKPITGAAVLRLIEQYPGKISLDTRVLDVVDVGPPPGSGSTDVRWRDVTIRHLLHHTGGWDRDTGYDPMFMPLRFARELGIAPPAMPEDIIRCMLGRPLDFDPGTREVYSNFGYCLLGRVIERVSGHSYEEYVREEILGPLGITRMRVGRTLLEGRTDGEVRYYDPGIGDNVFTEDVDEVAAPYGTFCLEAMDAHGGWIASAVDLVRFACAFDHPERCPVLAPASVAELFARPDGPAGYEADGTAKAAYYADGWLVRPTADGRANHWHNGSLPGTYSLLVRRHDGLNWAVIFNQRTCPEGLDVEVIDPALHMAADAVKRWPGDDLFGTFGAT